MMRFIFLLILTLTGCVSLLPSGEVNQQMIHLTPSLPRLSLSPVAWGLVILEPRTSAPLHTNLILVQSNLPTVHYVGGAVWSDVLPDMWRTLVFDAFLASHKIGNISMFNEGFSPAYGLSMTIHDFGLKTPPTETDPPTATISLTAQLLNFRDRRVVAMTQLKASEVCKSRQTTHVGEAFNHVASQILQKLVTWTLVEGGKNKTL